MSRLQKGRSRLVRKSIYIGHRKTTVYVESPFGNRSEKLRPRRVLNLQSCSLALLNIAALRTSHPPFASSYCIIM